MRTISDPVLGEFNVPGFPMKFSQTTAMEDLPAPFLGQHNAEVLMKRLHYTADQVAVLEAQGILCHETIPGAELTLTRE